MFIISPPLEAVAHDSPMLKDDHTKEHKNHESCGSPSFFHSYPFLVLAPNTGNSKCLSSLFHR
jgi:hypothetical protein